MHNDHHDQDMVHNKWQAVGLAAALTAVSVVALWAFAA
jgi:hypothetical protein